MWKNKWLKSCLKKAVASFMAVLVIFGLVPKTFSRAVAEPGGWNCTVMVPYTIYVNGRSIDMTGFVQIDADVQWTLNDAARDVWDLNATVKLTWDDRLPTDGLGISHLYFTPPGTPLSDITIHEAGSQILTVNTSAYGRTLPTAPYENCSIRFSYKTWDQRSVMFLTPNSAVLDYVVANSVDNGYYQWINIEPPTPPSGQKFIGWSLNSSTYEAAGTSAPDSAFKNYILKLYAFYSATATVSFDGNGHTGGSPPDDISYVQQGIFNFPEKGTLVNSGYTFVGWGDDTASYSNNVTIYQPGSSLVLPNTDSDKTFYAQWAKNYTLDYDLNGSAGTPP